MICLLTVFPSLANSTTVNLCTQNQPQPSQISTLHKMQYWEDLSIGQVFETSTITIDAAEIIAYAKQFDPQPYHLDPAIAGESIFGGHCASGWQVCALMMRLLADTMNAEDIPSAGSSAVESMRWLKPVFANDTLRATIEILKHRSAESHPHYGLTHCSIDVKNQHDKSVIVLKSDIMIEKRPESGNSGEVSHSTNNNA